MKTALPAFPRICYVLCALLGMVPLAHAYTDTLVAGINEQTGIRFKIGSPLAEVPAGGFYPVRIKVRNGTSQSRTWSLSFTSKPSYGAGTTCRSTETLTVGPGATREFDIFVPQSGLVSGNYDRSELQVAISGHGSSGEPFEISNKYRGGHGTAYIAMTEKLGGSVWSAMEAALKTTGASRSGSLESVRYRHSLNRTLAGSLVDLDEMPPDSRSFSGIAGLWMEIDEWARISPDRRAAITQWLVEGGSLFLVAEAPPAAPLRGLPSLSALGQAQPVGFGSVKLVQVPTASAISEIITDVLSLGAQPAPPWHEDYREKWALVDWVGWPKLNVPVVIGFVCVFGLLIGPVNLLFLAPARRRARLFLTVPAISFCACVILAGIIYIGDGVGGIGARSVVAYFQAGSNRVTLLQEQISRTRLLTSRQFTLPANVAMSVVQRSEDRNETRSVDRFGTQLDRDWFGSRTVQTHVLRTSTPTRAEVVLVSATGAAAPVLLSSIPSLLSRLYYIDASGGYWTAEKVGTGQPATLTASTRESFDQWLQTSSAEFSGNMSAVSKGIGHRREHFYATADPFADVPVDTLPSIAWKRQAILCFGTCQKGVSQ